MSVSATHLATRYESFRIPSILYRDRVLNGLINSIHAQDGFQMTTLATIIMLNIHEVFEADAESWVKHLKAAGTFVRNYLQKCENPDTSTRMLFDIFLYHNALALISTKQSDLFMEYYTSNSWCALKDRSAFLASVDTLLSLVARLSVFATNPNVSNSDSERNPELSVIHRKLQLWSPPDDISDDARNTAEAMRHAALLYYNQLACPFGASNAVITSYQAIIDHLREISIFSPAVASHLWPLYTAGAASRHLNGTNDDREFISNRLSQMQASRSIKSIDRVRECLEKLWLGSGAEVDSRTSLVLF
ncbi:hypothetical protein PHISCL_05757 [Aspergillus sclerotialis]|uniref:Uncharacterized protein n=1 Tax=Aspergillus sclerotialis TaxID=2070753 RepID=A0A3A2ZFN9_9EURO|nr:hypothetical protein PHISCL_05757 [Aspergillus sclerotialis]